MRYFILALALLFPSVSWAQAPSYTSIPPNTVMGNPNGWAENPQPTSNLVPMLSTNPAAVRSAIGAVNIGGDTMTGTLNVPTVNVNLGGAYNINGLTALKFGTATSAAPLFSGAYSGASINASQQFLTGFGAYTFESAKSGSPQESVAFGMGAGIACTTCGSLTLLGVGAGSALTTETGVVAIGGTTMRNASNAGATVAIGTGVFTDGSGVGNIAMGTLTFQGFPSSITVSGTGTVGDVMSFTFASTNSCNGTTVTVNCTSGAPVTKTVTVTSGNTSATAMANLILAGLNNTTGINYILGNGITEGTQNLYGLGFAITDPTNSPTVVTGHYPTSWQISISYSCSGVCGQTVTITADSNNSNNLVIGNNVLYSPTVAGASSNVILGNFSAAYFATNASYNNFVGVTSAPKITNATFNNGMGYQNFSALTTGSQNIAIGSYAGFGLTTGQRNTLVGDATVAGLNCVTTGFQNIELGAGACVPSPTTPFQMSIANAIWGKNNSGSGSTVSTGQIGVMTPAPNATFTVGDGAGSATQGSHIGVLQTTKPAITGCTGCSLDATASDTAGVITEGTAQTGFVLTWKVAFATAPHCVVSSPNGATFTSYTPTTTSLTVVNTTVTGAQYSYNCLQ